MANPDHVTLLTTALRSDRFRQGTGHLTIDPGTLDERNCCLGVACIIAMENGLELEYIDANVRLYLDDDGHTCGATVGDGTCGCYSNDTVLPFKVQKWYGFSTDDPQMTVTLTSEEGVIYLENVSASSLNDEREFDFAQIADAFDANYVHTAEPEDPDGALEP